MQQIFMKFTFQGKRDMTFKSRKINGKLILESAMKKRKQTKED